MVLLIDNFDSFTYNLVDYLHRAGTSCKVIRNNISPSEIDISQYSGLMISPGPETPAKAGFLTDYLKLFLDKLPVLGICLGHQAIGEFFGASLVKGIKPMHGKVSKISLADDPLFSGISCELEVVRYNSLVLKNLPKDLISIAETREGEIMALRHRHYPIWGLQFHPEAAMTRGGLIMLKNWISLNKIADSLL